MMAEDGVGNMIERTQRRLRQVRFFYQHLVNARQQTRGDPEAFRFYFSAFIQAARSVTWTLSNEQPDMWKAWEPNWAANQSEEEQKLLKIATHLRNVEVKEGGANLPTELEEAVIDAFVETSRVEASNPMGGITVWGQFRKQKVKRPVHYFQDEDGKEEATALCLRYLYFLEKMVGDFCADMKVE
jgi:hypothetical protein